MRASTGNCPHRRRDAAWPRSSTGELINSKSFLITRRAEHGQRLVSFAVGGSRNRFGYTRRAVFPDYTLLPFGMYTLLKTFEVKDSSFHPGTYTGTLNVALTFAQQKRWLANDSHTQMWYERCCFRITSKRRNIKIILNAEKFFSPITRDTNLLIISTNRLHETSFFNAK